MRHHDPCGHGPGHGVGPPASDGAACPAVGSPGGLDAVPGAAEPGRQSGKRSERRPEDGRPRQARPPQYVPRPRPRHFRAFHRVRHHRRRSSRGSHLARCRLGHFEDRRHRRSRGLHPVLRCRPAKLDHAPVQRRLRRARHGHSLPAVSAGQLQLAAEHGLTNRETDILLLLAQGRDAQFVSDALYLSRNTVKSYQKSIYAKLGVHSKQEIIELVAPSL
ncbi:MAG: helix-turn-helix transcriptional regulator [Adlercreutzia equolifaciens]|nr:helix-turn-helix transcriptional regulator [Adlercreutzia equolifaciens]